MRPTLDEYFIAMARLVASRGTCPRRQVGCILADGLGRVLSTGYNGAPSGQPHCEDEPCPGRGAPSGSSLDLCAAIHAEQNAIMFCADVRAIETCYCTAFPCASCAKLLLNTSCKRIVFVEDYPSGGAAQQLWRRAGRTWQQAAEPR
jgi:dCMP deaminase